MVSHYIDVFSFPPQYIETNHFINRSILLGMHSGEYMGLKNCVKCELPVHSLLCGRDAQMRFNSSVASAIFVTEKSFPSGNR